jgi:putative hemolysin
VNSLKVPWYPRKDFMWLRCHVHDTNSESSVHRIANHRPLPGPLANAVNRLLQIDRLEDLYARTRSERDFVRRLLDDLEIHVDVRESDFEKIPRSGPLVAVSNHPFGILDGVMLADLLTRARPDVRILTNRLLGGLQELAPICFFISESRLANGRALKQAVRHLRAGGMLLIFPAGEVSHFDLKKRVIRDPEWNPAAARLIRLTGAKSLPILIRGANGLPFQMLGMVHPMLRTAALPAEMPNKRGKSVEIRIGGAVEPSRIEALPNDAEATRYFRLRTELLAGRGNPQNRTLRACAASRSRETLTGSILTISTCSSGTKRNARSPGLTAWRKRTKGSLHGFAIPFQGGLLAGVARIDCALLRDKERGRLGAPAAARKVG